MAESLTTRQVADLLGWDAEKVRLYCQEGRFPKAFKDPQGKWLVPRSDLRPFEKAASVKASPAKKSAAAKAPAKQIPAKKAPAKQTPAKKSPARQTPARKAPAKRAPARQTPAVGRDQIRVGDVSGVAAIGSQARVEITSGATSEIGRVFQGVYASIEQRPPDPEAPKTELTAAVQAIEKEVGQGEDANPDRLRIWLKFLGGMAPDILDVALAALKNPAAGIAAVVRKVVERAEAERAGARLA